jgi:hypothetical protein
MEPVSFQALNNGPYIQPQPVSANPDSSVIDTVADAFNISKKFDDAWNAYYAARSSLDAVDFNALSETQQAQWLDYDAKIENQRESVESYESAYNTARNLFGMDAYTRPGPLGFVQFTWPLAAVAIAALATAYAVFVEVKNAAQQAFGVSPITQPGPIERTANTAIWVIGGAIVAVYLLPQLLKGSKR